jgi:hypothetical protein
MAPTDPVRRVGLSYGIAGGSVDLQRLLDVGDRLGVLALRLEEPAESHVDERLTVAVPEIPVQLERAAQV